MQAIFIEVGHGVSKWGRKDVGAVGRFGDSVYHERVIAKELGRRVIEILKTKKELGDCLIQGVGVETEAKNSAKMRYINTVIRENKFSPGNCLGVSIHMNSFGTNVPRGFEVWYGKNGLAKGLAENIYRSWVKYALTPLRKNPIISTAKHRFKKLYIDDTICPMVLVETSFISNLADVQIITGNYDRVAECLAHGIMEYIRGL